MKNLFIAAMLYAGAVSANPSSANPSAMGDIRPLDLSQTFELEGDSDALAADYVSMREMRELQGLNRIAIATVCVQFVTGKSANGLADGASRYYKRTANGAIPGGLDAQEMQGVADSFLSRLESDFISAGYDVVPYAELQADPLYQQIEAGFTRGMLERARTRSFENAATVSETYVSVSPKQRPYNLECTDFSPEARYNLALMAYQLNAEILTAAVVVDMGQINEMNGQKPVDTDFAQFIRAGDSHYQFIGKTGPSARLWLKQSMVPAQNPFSQGATLSGSQAKAGARAPVAFDAASYFQNADDHLRVMVRMFLQAIRNN